MIVRGGKASGIRGERTTSKEMVRPGLTAAAIRLPGLPCFSSSTGGNMMCSAGGKRGLGQAARTWLDCAWVFYRKPPFLRRRFPART